MKSNSPNNVQRATLSNSILKLNKRVYNIDMYPSKILKLEKSVIRGESVEKTYKMRPKLPPRNTCSKMHRVKAGNNICLLYTSDAADE